MTKYLSGLGKGAAVCSFAIALTLSTPASAQNPPPQPGVNELGGPGPCTQGTRQEGFGPRGYNWLYVPAGTGTPRTGGQCNDANRPIIFFAPGYIGIPIWPSRYQDLINNMVSNGYAVAFTNTSSANPDPGYYQMFSGFEFAATTLNARAGNRLDLNNIGVWGHSFGAGATPWLAQQFVQRGWGANSLWLSANASSWVFFQGDKGTPIPIAPHIRAQVIAYEDDTTVDQEVAIDLFNWLSIPTSQRDFIQVIPKEGYKAGHGLPGVTDPPNYLEYYGVYRNYQALADCSRSGTNCSTDLGFMGTFSDGAAAPRAIVSDDPQDRGKPDVLVECGKSSNTRENYGRCSKK